MAFFSTSWSCFFFVCPYLVTSRRNKVLSHTMPCRSRDREALRSHTFFFGLSHSNLNWWATMDFSVNCCFFSLSIFKKLKKKYATTVQILIPTFVKWISDSLKNSMTSLSFVVCIFYVCLFFTLCVCFRIHIPRKPILCFHFDSKFLFMFTQLDNFHWAVFLFREKKNNYVARDTENSWVVNGFEEIKKKYNAKLRFIQR